MTMKITNGQLIDAWPAIQNLGALKGLPTKTSYWLGKSIAKLKGRLEDCERTRVKILLDHAELDADGNPVTMGAQVKLKDAKAFEAAFGELRGIEIDVDVKQVALADLGATALTPADFTALDWLIVE